MRTEYTYKCTNCVHTEEVSEKEVYRTRGVSTCPSCGKKMVAEMTFVVPGSKKRGH